MGQSMGVGLEGAVWWEPSLDGGDRTADASPGGSAGWILESRLLC